MFLHLIVHWNILRFLTSRLVKISLIQAQCTAKNFYIQYIPKESHHSPPEGDLTKRKQQSEEKIDIPPNDLLLSFP